MRPAHRSLARFLRSPAVIVGELAALALAGALGAIFPQRGAAAGDQSYALAHALALDRVFCSGWFLAAVACTALSLSIVIADQVRRLRAAWVKEPSEGDFAQAPFRLEFERQSRRVPPGGASGKQVRAWTERRWGLLGSPLLHAGALLVIAAGILRALFAADAVVDLLEGETLAPSAEAWSAQWPGVLGPPLRLAKPVTLNAVRAERYAGGELCDLSLDVSVGDGKGAEPATIAVNRGLQVAGVRVFPASRFGPAAMVEWAGADGAVKREAALLSGAGKGAYEGSSRGPAGLVAHLRARLDARGGRPSSFEVRVMRANALLLTAEGRVGDRIAIPGGGELALCGAPLWARLQASRDPGQWLAYAGLGLVIAGAFLVFGFVKLDMCVAVTPAGEREHVCVALKAQRLAPLFRERFEELVRAEGGAGEDAARDPGRREMALPGGAQRGARLAACFMLPLALFGAASCRRAPEGQARELVERYNRVVSEAYRRGDVKLIDPVVGPNEGRKITGLIGVRLDMGLTLDSQLLALDVTRAEKTGDALRVWTKETWRYRDLKIGSGEQVGQASRDVYEMLYVFRKAEGDWRVDEIQFAVPPQVGRGALPWNADHVPAHGHAGRPDATGGGGAP